jgi:ferredoxin
VTDRIVFACSCEKSMPLDAASIGAACGGTLRTADQLCGGELDRFREAVSTGAPVTVSCTLQAPLFDEVAAELAAEDRIAYANIRENAGWSAEARRAGPKMAALLAAAAEPAHEAAAVSLESGGVALVYGRDETAVEAGRRLADHLDVTVLLRPPAAVEPLLSNEFPVLQGAVRNAAGRLGAFEVKVDAYAAPAPSSRERLLFGAPRDGATSTCDLILDLSGGAPLFPAHETRAGYLRADPRDPAAVERAIAAASHLVGTFDKPRYVDFDAAICAHARSGIAGCSRCLSVCPTGAIRPAGESVAIDPYVCAGCGSCAAVCPTGAAGYAVPPADALMRRLRAMLLAYRDAGGRDAVVLFHEGDHGEPLIHALARHGEGLPARVLPLRVNEVTQIGPEQFAALFAYGAAGAQILARGRPKHDLDALERAVGLGNALATAQGYAARDGAPPLSIVAVDDPDGLAEALAGAPGGSPAPSPSRFMPFGGKRETFAFALRQMHAVAPAPAALTPLEVGAPFGGLAFRAESCTLCLACVGACPTQALSDNQERPQLTFKEDLCVQCGLCAATCPEDAISLKPQIDFEAWAAPRRTLKEEEPFQCVVCAKPFGVRSTIERVIEKLGGRHWMFSGAEGERRLGILRMCDDCRVGAALNEGFDPHAAPVRPEPRTTEDYLRERAARSAAASAEPALSGVPSPVPGIEPAPPGPPRS